jgi:hypothetical protein
MPGEVVEITVGAGLGGPGAVMRGLAGMRVLMTTNRGWSAGDDGLSRPAAGDRDTEAAGTAQGSLLRMCET